ncbi:MAG: protein-methionine-sulfoxide reductase heme-binding subunit MsrQ [Nitrospirota bacterium]
MDTQRHQTTRTDNRIGLARVALGALGLAPLAVLTWRAFTDDLGANPIETVERFTGWWTLTLLMVTLAVTPIRLLTGWTTITRLRRMLGLFAFFWACLHLSAYAGLDQFFALKDIVKDVAKRPYITVGFTTFLLLLPLAVTSTDRMIRRLGGARWRKLHRLAYVAAAGGVLHFLWLVKADIARPFLFASVLIVLLAVRLRKPVAGKARPSESGDLLETRRAA